MEKYECSRCKKLTEDGTVYHFKSIHKSHTLLSIQMCLDCRDVVFAYIKKDTSQQSTKILKEVFTYGDATNTHLDILKHLYASNIPESEFITWGRNASQQDIPPVSVKDGTYFRNYCPIHED